MKRPPSEWKKMLANEATGINLQNTQTAHDT